MTFDYDQWQNDLTQIIIRRSGGAAPPFLLADRPPPFNLQPAPSAAAGRPEHHG
jgi:hypothetical protein